MSNEQIGKLLQQLANDEESLHKLVVKGNGMRSSLEAIAKWLDGLNESKEYKELRIERGHKAWVDGSGNIEIPEDLKGHIEEVLELQDRIAHTKKDLKDRLGIDTYAKYSVSIT